MKSPSRHGGAPPRGNSGSPKPLYVTVSGFDRPRRPAISRDDEQRTDDRQTFQRVHEGLGIFGRRLIPEIVEIIDCRGDKENQKNGKEPYAQIEGNHQSGDDLESSDSNGKHLRGGHSRHRFQLRSVGNKEGGNDDSGGNKIGGGLNAKKLGRPRIDKKHGEQDSSESNERWHGRPHWMLRMWVAKRGAERLWAFRFGFSNSQIESHWLSQTRSAADDWLAPGLRRRQPRSC